MKNTSLKKKIIIGASTLGFVALTVGLGVGISTSRINKDYSSEFVVSDKAKVIGDSYPDLATDLAQLKVNQRANGLTATEVLNMIQNTKFAFNLNSLVDFSKLEQKYPNLHFQVSALANTATSATSITNVAVLAFDKSTDKAVSAGSVVATISGFAKESQNVNQSEIATASLSLEGLTSYSDLLPSQFSVLIQNIFATQVNKIVNTNRAAEARQPQTQTSVTTSSNGTSQTSDAQVSTTSSSEVTTDPNTTTQEQPTVAQPINLDQSQLETVFQNAIAQVGNISFETAGNKLVYLPTTTKLIAVKEASNKGYIKVNFNDADGTASFKAQIIDAQNQIQNITVNVQGLASTAQVVNKFKQEFAKTRFFELSAQKRAELLNQAKGFYQLIGPKAHEANLFSAWFDQKQTKFGDFNVTFNIEVPDQTSTLDANGQVALGAKLTYDKPINISAENLKFIDLPGAKNLDEQNIGSQIGFVTPSLKVTDLISTLFGNANQKAFYDIAGSNPTLKIKSNNFLTIFASDVQRVTNNLSDWAKYTPEQKNNIIDFFNNFATDVNKTIVTKVKSETQTSQQDKVVKPVEVSETTTEQASVQPQATVKTEVVKAGDFLGQTLDELSSKFADLKVDGNFDEANSMFKLTFTSQNETIGQIEISNVSADNVAYQQAKEDGVAYFLDAEQSLVKPADKIVGDTTLYALNNNFATFSDKKEETATKTEATKTEAAKPVATKTEATKPVATKTEATKTEAAKPVVTKAEAAKPTATKTEESEEQAPKKTPPVKLPNYLTKNGLLLNNALKYQGKDDEDATTLKDGVIYLAFQPTKDLENGKKYNLLSGKVGDKSKGTVSVFIQKLNQDVQPSSSGTGHSQEENKKDLSDSLIIGIEYKDVKDVSASASQGSGGSGTSNNPLELLALAGSNNFSQNKNNKNISIKKVSTDGGSSNSDELISLQDINESAIPAPSGSSVQQSDDNKRHINATSKGKFDEQFQTFLEDASSPLLLEIVVKKGESIKFTLIPRTATNNGDSYISQTINFNLKETSNKGSQGAKQVKAAPAGAAAQAPTPSDKTLAERGLDFYQIGDTKASKDDGKGTIIFKSFAVFKSDALAKDEKKIMKLRQSFVKQYLSFK